MILDPAAQCLIPSVHENVDQTLLALDSGRLVLQKSLKVKLIQYQNYLFLSCRSPPTVLRHQYASLPNFFVKSKMAPKKSDEVSGKETHRNRKLVENRKTKKKLNRKSIKNRKVKNFFRREI